MRLDLGDIPTWLGGGATVATLVYIARTQRMAETDRASALAAKLNIWLNDYPPRVAARTDPVSGLPVQEAVCEVVIDNRADAPAHAVCVKVGSHRAPGMAMRQLFTFAPGEHRVAVIEVRVSLPGGELASPWYPPPVEVTFADAAGVRWRKTMGGSLERMRGLRSWRHLREVIKPFTHRLRLKLGRRRGGRDL